jgi:hypothetical protein
MLKAAKPVERETYHTEDRTSCTHTHTHTHTQTHTHTHTRQGDRAIGDTNHTEDAFTH